MDHKSLSQFLQRFLPCTVIQDMEYVKENCCSNQGAFQSLFVVLRILSCLKYGINSCSLV